jgi:hypothetical protein
MGILNIGNEIGRRNEQQSASGGGGGCQVSRCGGIPARGYLHFGFIVAIFDSILLLSAKPRRQSREGLRKGDLLRHLRFSPDEYRLLADLWHQLALDGRPRPVCKRLLAENLSELSANLSRRITRLTRAECELLCNHFRQRTPCKDKHDFTAEELQLVLAACGSPPLPVRFVGLFKGILVELFRVELPELSLKVDRLSGHQFERLYEQATRQSREKK